MPKFIGSLNNPGMSGKISIIRASLWLSFACGGLFTGNLLLNAGVLHSDSLVAIEAVSLPWIDGVGDDACWESASWQPIDQMWISWGEPLLPFDDFKGEFKVMWSSETDELYFLVRTTDDVFVDGYVWPGGKYPDYDILEVFIDEDYSGGTHIFDTENTLAANAFSYHIVIDEPADEGITDLPVVCDIAGTSWGDRTTPDYAGHFPELVVSREGRNFIWEFSMVVHSDTYDHTDPEASVVELTAGKIMGLSMAYCDNDDPDEDPLARDNFIGSVYVTEEAYNDHWQNADGYGTLTLVEYSSSVATDHLHKNSGINIYPNPMIDSNIHISIESDLSGNQVVVRVLSMNRQELYRKVFERYQSQFTRKIALEGIVPGIYLIEIDTGDQIFVRKFARSTSHQ